MRWMVESTESRHLEKGKAPSSCRETTFGAGEHNLHYEREIKQQASCEAASGYASCDLTKICKSRVPV
jgi:hypothetical protein